MNRWWDFVQHRFQDRKSDTFPDLDHVHVTHAFSVYSVFQKDKSKFHNLYNMHSPRRNNHIYPRCVVG